MINTPATFTSIARSLHWVMAALIVAMIFIGVGMAATTSERYRVLLGWHKPLGALVLGLALIRLLYRLRHSPPPLPSDLPHVQRLAATASHYALYALMIAMPLIGWAMLSAAPYPVTLGGLRLPALMSPDAIWFGRLRLLHGWLGLAFFGLILVHLGAALMHALIRRDGVFQSMTGGVDRIR